MSNALALTLLKVAAGVAIIPAGHAALSYRTHQAIEQPESNLTPAILEVEDTARQIPISNDGLFYIDATVNGSVIHFVVDSGANTTILDQADARRVGFRPEGMHFHQKVVTANGEAPLAVVNVTKFQIAGKSYADVPMTVFGRAGGVSLLGQDMIGRLGGLSITDGVLTLPA